MMRVFIDFGHGTRRGRKDPGAVSDRFPTMTEAEFVYPVGLLAGHMLRSNGFEVMFSRDLDGDVSLPERALIADKWNADVVVSIHCNAVESPSARGYEVLHYGSEDGEKLARSLLDALSYYVEAGELPPLKNRGLKERPKLDILRLTEAPAALIEPEFISSPEGRAVLASPENQIAFARAIALGVRTYGDRR